MDKLQLTNITNQIFVFFIQDLCKTNNITIYRLAKDTNLIRLFVPLPYQKQTKLKMKTLINIFISIGEFIGIAILLYSFIILVELL